MGRQGIEKRQETEDTKTWEREGYEKPGQVTQRGK